LSRPRPSLSAVTYDAGMSSQRWASELAASLVGEPVDLSDTLPDARLVLAALEQRSWPASRIEAVARRRFDAEEAWPFPVARQVVAAGPAQWYALVGEARTLLGLDGDVQPPTTRTALTADERRLLNDVPPHW
jgi:hypothetical protein